MKKQGQQIKLVQDQFENVNVDQWGVIEHHVLEITLLQVAGNAWHAAKLTKVSL